MKNTKNGLIPILIILVILVSIVGGFYFYKKAFAPICWPYCSDMTEEDRIEIRKSAYKVDSNSEKMKISLFVQDREIAAISDCGATRKIEIEIPKSEDLVFASLKALFEFDLDRYGVFEAVDISNKIAKVTLKSDFTPTGLAISSLSSCETQHLFSTITDTLSQYESVESVQIYTIEGRRIEF